MLFQQHEQSLLVHAPAKLNLSLEVLARRADGYHELETLMIAVDLYDTIRLTPADDDAIDFRGAFVARQPASGLSLPQDANNLIVKTVQLLKRETGCRQGVQVRLFKRIPLASGLGGGSSNAAAVLVALNRLWQLNLDHHDLHRLAAQLGSDVNFFLAPSGLALCTGRGESIQPLRYQHHFHFVVARMNAGLSTAQVFAHCKPEGVARSTRDLLHNLERGDAFSASQSLYNALQAPAERLETELADMKSRFHELPVIGHSMSGSGTAYYGWCANRKLAHAAAARLRSQGVPFVVTVQSRC